MAPVTLEDPQVIPEQAAVAQAPSGRNRSMLLFAGIAFLLVLLLAGGAIALLGSRGEEISGSSEHRPREAIGGPGKATENGTTVHTPGSSAAGEETVDLSNDTSPPAESTMPSSTRSAPPHSGPNGTASSGLEAQGEQAARDYYDAAENGDWKYTYSHLYYPDKERYTYDQWVTANKNAGTASSTFQIDSVEAVDTKLGAPAVQVDLTIYAANDDTFTRTTHLYLIDGLWEHVLTDEERAVFDKYQ